MKTEKSYCVKCSTGKIGYVIGTRKVALESAVLDFGFVNPKIIGRGEAVKPEAKPLAKAKKAKPLAKVTFTSGRVEFLKYNHYCGGSSIKLPKDMAEGRALWTHYGVGKMLGKHQVATIDWNPSEQK